MPKGHTVRPGGEVAKWGEVRSEDMGLCFIRVEGEVSGIYQSHLLLANLKHKRGK